MTFAPSLSNTLEVKERDVDDYYDNAKEGSKANTCHDDCTTPT